jgi:hypothetical protein
MMVVLKIFVAILVMIVVALGLVVLVVETKLAISFRLFRRREAGHVFLICTSRRNWYDFLRNNVIPILPDNFRVVWSRPMRGAAYPHLFYYFFRSGIRNVSKPYLVAVTRRALVYAPLNTALQELKVRPKKSVDTRRRCAHIISTALQQLRTTRSSCVSL